MGDKIIIAVCGYPELYNTYAVFQPSIAHKAQLPSQQNPCQPFRNETGDARLAEAPPMTQIHVCCEVNFTRE